MKNGYTHISMVLDRSGSMASCADDTRGGFNAFIEEQKKQPGEATLTLTQFDDVIETVHSGIPLRDVPTLRFEPRGMTALLDAIGKAINTTGQWLSAKPEHERPEKVVFVILTDGHENASREFTRAKVFEMIRHQETNYRWQFVFLGANQDAIKAGADLGISAQSSMTYDTRNTRQVYANLTSSVNALRSTGKAVAFSDIDRLKATKDPA